MFRLLQVLHGALSWWRGSFHRDALASVFLCKRDLSQMAGMTSNVLAIAMVFISRAAFAADAIGQVKTETGTVRIERSGAGTLASVGDHVYQSDMIVTGSKSTVGITFADNSMMSLGPNSRLSLDQFRFDTTTQDGAFVARSEER